MNMPLLKIANIFIIGLMAKIILNNLNLDLITNYINIFFCILIPLYDNVEGYILYNFNENINFNVLNKGNENCQIGSDINAHAGSDIDARTEYRYTQRKDQKFKPDSIIKVDKTKLSFAKKKYLTRVGNDFTEFFVKYKPSQVLDDDKLHNEFMKKVTKTGTTVDEAAGVLPLEIKENFLKFFYGKYKDCSGTDLIKPNEFYNIPTPSIKHKVYE